MDIIFLMLKICIDNLRCKTKLRYSNEMERIDYTANCVDHWLTTVYFVFIYEQVVYHMRTTLKRHSHIIS